MTIEEVCVDAGLAVKLVVAEPDSEAAETLFRRWVDTGTEIIAPTFFEVEADSILRKKLVARRVLSTAEAEIAFRDLQSLPIIQLSLTRQRQRAWEIAQEFGMSTVYDATYLALAELRGCEFWTADERLFNTLMGQLKFVRWLGELG